ncbi:transcriptional regulator domain-containing protein [Sphingobium sp. TCM1]|uniref:transcriptional regulator domain-containing protein n=1 Tax=Sphingobium sp. TCM1 TaxID=453246 RepID=UPI000A079AC8|nr:DUF6499 domain-containing protein [Sphingobium sp. TCM1]
MSTPHSRSQRRGGSRPDAIGRADIAAEFLRRNPTYRTEHAQMLRRIEAGSVTEDAAKAAFARRWGLSFRLPTG